ncbi:hypothetical protein ACOSQ4_026735 [Xanthoceras sorbifolium]
MVVKVYGPVMAGCPQRVLACLLEKDVEFEDCSCRSRPRRAKPFGQVLAVEDAISGFLVKSRAIIRYYAAKYADSGSNLLGTTLEERATVDQWLEVEAHFNDLVHTIVLQLTVLPSMGQPGDLALVHSCEQKLEVVFDVYERRLSKSKYLAGDWFSLADLSHLPATTFLMEEAKLGHLVKERKHVNGWWEEISGLPAWKKVMKLAGF